MDGDLAFCLGHFIDDQVQLIDDRLDDIQQKEIVKCQEIEKEKAIYDQNKPPAKNKGFHHEDQSLVDQFIQELRDATQATNTKTIIDDPACIDTLRAETSTKVNACAGYITRLRNLAKPLPNTASFVQACNETIVYFQSPQVFDGNFKGLMLVLERSDATDLLQNVQNWWKEAYGSQLSDINRRNDRFNKAITEKNFAILSQTSRILDNSRKLLAARTIIAVVPPTQDIIRKFVRGMLAIDEERREKINPDELTEQLNNQDVEEVINYARGWLAKRDEVRNQKEEVNPYDVKLEDAKAEFGRQRLAQEAKKLALAALLCRLAVGSTNGEQFDQQLQKTIHGQKKKSKESLPVISGDIKEPEAQELPVIIQLELNDTDMERWDTNTDGIREQFAAALCKVFLIPDKKIRVDGIERDKGIVRLCVQPPYGKIVIDSLNGTARDAVARMKALRKCCTDLHANIESITLGDFGLKVEDRLMDPRWNKTYIWPDSTDKGECWTTPIMYGGKPYYCPSGWKRFGIKVAEDAAEFDSHWGTWHVAYHGTAGDNASKILTSGLKVSTEGCFYQDGVPRVYASPSVEYSGHPRYARPWKRANRDGQECWYQLVFQCRINPTSLAKIGPETLIHDEYKQTVTVDANFDNGELEWIILGEDNEGFIKRDIICYGIMMRISNVDPKSLTPSAWWKHSHWADQYAK